MKKPFRMQKNLQKKIRRRERLLTLKTAQQLAYQTDQLISENGDKFSADDKSALETKSAALKEALKGDDLDAIKAAQDDLQNKFYEVSQKLYQAAQAAQGAQGAPEGGTQGGADQGYTDADYTEVDDN